MKKNPNLNNNNNITISNNTASIIFAHRYSL